MKLAKETTENLISFYKRIAEENNLQLLDRTGVTLVSNPSGSWPDFLLGGEGIGKVQLEPIAKDMLEGKVPSIWIRERNKQDPFDLAASEYGIRQVNLWTGMSMEIDEAFQINVPGNLVIERVHEESVLEEWLALVNKAVLSGNKIEQTLFKELMCCPEFEFYGLREDKKLVSTALIFLHNNVCGLYFIATSGDKRGRGYASMLVSAAINICFSKGIHKFVLHSTPIGKSLYHKLGFRDNLEYGIYWMLGKR